jgi:hypothetical protein
MRRIVGILMFLVLLSGCEKYVVEKSDVTLSGKYVISKLNVINVDQSQTPDSLYLMGSTYVNHNLPKPFDSIVIDNFYLHMDYSTIRLNMLGVTSTGQDIWEYGNSPDEIFYRILGNNSYCSGYLQFTYITSAGNAATMTFLIEDDGFESLQLKSEGAWFEGDMGQKQVMTLGLTRVGP